MTDILPSKAAYLFLKAAIRHKQVLLFVELEDQLDTEPYIVLSNRLRRRVRQSTGAFTEENSCAIKLKNPTQRST